MIGSVRIIFAVIFIFFTYLCTYSQCKLPIALEPSTKPRLARLFPYAVIDLPSGFKVISSKGYVDAWSGSMASADDKFKIEFSGGTVESIFEKYKKKLTCTEIIKGFEFPVKIGILKSHKQEIMIAKVFWAQFVATVKNDDENAQFLQIVTSYRKEMSKSPE